MQRPFPIFAADPEASLHHGREHEYCHCPICELERRAYLVEELTERRLHLRLDLGPRCGLTRRGRPGRHDHANKKGKTACPHSRHSPSPVGQQFSLPKVDCYATLPWEVMPMQGDGIASGAAMTAFAGARTTAPGMRVLSGYKRIRLHSQSVYDPLNDAGPHRDRRQDDDDVKRPPSRLG